MLASEPKNAEGKHDCDDQRCDLHDSDPNGAAVAVKIEAGSVGGLDPITPLDPGPDDSMPCGLATNTQLRVPVADFYSAATVTPLGDLAKTLRRQQQSL